MATQLMYCGSVSDLQLTFFLHLVGRSKNKDKCMFLLYLLGNAVVNAKGNNSRSNKEGGGQSGLAMDFSMKELYAIQEIQSEEKLLQLLVQ